MLQRVSGKQIRRVVGAIVLAGKQGDGKRLEGRIFYGSNHLGTGASNFSKLDGVWLTNKTSNGSLGGVKKKEWRNMRRRGVGIGKRIARPAVFPEKVRTAGNDHKREGLRGTL